MTMTSRLPRLCACAALLLLGLSFAGAAHAQNRLQAGTLSYQLPGASNNGQFTVNLVLPWTANGQPAVGTNLTIGQLHFGDGSSQAVTLQVISVDPANDWLTATAQINHNYGGGASGAKTAVYTGCCKLSTLSNNANAPWQLQTMVALSSPRDPSSPVITVPPMISLQNGQAAATFSIAATNADAGTLRYRLATAADGFSGTQPAGLSVNATTGIATWNTTSLAANSTWNAAVVVEEVDGGNVSTKSMLDFIIKITAPKPINVPPQFTYGGVTPDNGSIIVAVPFAPVSFTVRAQDSNLGDEVTLNATGLPPGSATSPPLPVYGNPATTVFSWIPGPLDLGIHVVSFTAQDEQGALATTAVAIHVANQAPVAQNDAYAIDEDAILQPVSGVLSNDSDADGHTLMAELVTSPSYGALHLNPDGSFTYAPAADFNGSDGFTYRVSDGVTYSAPASVNIAVIPVNDAPVAREKSVVTDEDMPREIEIRGTDIDGDGLSFEIVSSPAHGILTPVVGVMPGNAAQVIYTPNPNYHGPDAFAFRVTDGALYSDPAIVSITVLSVNDPPVAERDFYDVDEDNLLNVPAPGVLSNDTDVDGDALSVSDTRSGALTLNADGSFSYMPSLNFFGLDPFSYMAYDGFINSAPAEVVITVHPVNDPPIASPQSVETNEDTPKPITLTGSDVEGDVLSFVIVTWPAHGSLTGSAPDVTYVPDHNYYGPDEFSFYVSDGQLVSEPVEVTLSVLPVNDAPVANPGTVELAEDTSKEFILTGSDVDGDVITFTVLSGPAFGALTGTEPILTYTPAPNYYGSDEVTFEVSDGELTATAKITIIVTPVNDAPVVSGVLVSPSLVAINGQVQAVATFSDVDGPSDSHTATWNWGSGTTTNGDVGTDGSVTGTYAYATTGVFTVTVSLVDAGGLSDRESFEYVVVYDPSGGFVTGGGWINSPAGACRFEACTENTTGKANFGFNSKYKKGTSVPTGETQFQFTAGGLNFHSTAYEWLVVSGANAKYKGTGTVNGQGSYGFMLTATDGQISGGGGVDKFRIKIWDKNNSDAVIYDNKMGSSDDSYDGTPLGGGSIVIHTGGGNVKQSTAAASDEEAVAVQAATEIGDVAVSQDVPQEFALQQNYPNPFNPATEINFGLPEASHVRIVVFDALGRQVMELLNQSVPAGTHRVAFDASSLPSGVYLYHIQAGSFTASRSMILQK